VHDAGALANGYKPEQVAAALAATIQWLPQAVRQPLTSVIDGLHKAVCTRL
jgi:hypothetical protein